MSLLKIAMAVFSLALGNSHSPSLAFNVVSQNHPVASSWVGSAGGLTLDISFEQGVDSIYARGTYKVATSKHVGCGGESLASNGFVTMRAHGTRNSFQGHLLFGSGWTPPVTGTATGSGGIRVDIHSVDRGLCTLILRKATAPTRPARP